MTSRTASKIKQRRERLRENQTPVVVRKPNKLWFWILAAASIVVIIFLSYSAYTSDLADGLIIPITAAIAVLLLLIIWYLPKFYVSPLPFETGKDFDREKERLKLEDDTRKTFAQIVGGIVILGSLILTYSTFRLQQEGHFAERFNKAITQLSDDKLPIRLAGMFSLERIARDSHKDNWMVMEILSTYIRDKAKKETDKNLSNKSANDKPFIAERDAKIAPDIQPDFTNSKVTNDIQAALSIIGRRKIEQDSKTDRINLSDTDLSRAFLGGANLSGAFLIRTDLSKAVLIVVNLSDADLSDADLSGANFHGADLRGANLFNANLRRADLNGASLREAKLVEADLAATYFSGADLRGADLSLAKNLTFEQLTGAIINENTILPENLESRKSELIQS